MGFTTCNSSSKSHYFGTPCTSLYCIYILGYGYCFENFENTAQNPSSLKISIYWFFPWCHEKNHTKPKQKQKNWHLWIKQDGPSLESSSYLNVTLRYLGPLDPGTIGPLDVWTFWPLDLGTLGLKEFGTSSLHHLLPSLPSYLFLLPLPTSSYTGLVWFGMGKGRWDNLRWLVSGIEFLHDEISMLFCSEKFSGWWWWWWWVTLQL